jgi:hypothetical protein
MSAPASLRQAIPILRIFSVDKVTDPFGNRLIFAERSAKS